MAPEGLPQPIRVALDVAGVMERLGISYVAVGSLASSLYGAPRSTDDVDFVVALDPELTQRLVTALAPVYYVSPEAAQAAAALPRSGSFNAIHLETAVKVDLFVAGQDAFDRERLRQRRRVRLEQTATSELFVDTPEHTVLRKLEWYRRGGEVSERQWRDVVSVLRAQHGRLDETTLRTWSERLGVADLLQRAMREGVAPGG